MQFWYSLTLPGEFVHKEANSEAAEEKPERRDHNDEGYFAYSSSHQILEEKLLILYCFKTIKKKHNEIIKNCKQRLNRIRLRIQVGRWTLTQGSKGNIYSRTHFFY
jgi:hypothetical protein